MTAEKGERLEEEKVEKGKKKKKIDRWGRRERGITNDSSKPSLSFLSHQFNSHLL